MSRKIVLWYGGFVVLLSLGLTGWLFGCDRPTTTYSQDVKSSDGQLIAEVRTVNIPVMPGGDVETTVTLKRSHGVAQPEQILGVADGPYTVHDPGLLDVRWVDSSRLVILYRGTTQPQFLAARAYGVAIVFEPVPGSPREPRR